MRLGLDCSRFGSCFFARKDFPCGVRNRMQDKILFRQLRFIPFSSARYFDMSPQVFVRGLLVVVSKRYTLKPHRVGGNRKRYQQSTNADKKSIETVFSIAICRQCGNKWQSKTLFLTIISYLRSSIVLAFSIAAYRV